MYVYFLHLRYVVDAQDSDSFRSVLFVFLFQYEIDYLHITKSLRIVFEQDYVARHYSLFSRPGAFKSVFSSLDEFFAMNAARAR